MVKLGVCRPQKPPTTTYLFPNSNIIDTVRLPLISEKTHSWGKIAVKKKQVY
jgi:regulator of PEP synthase PpsR (kinase-PPPase family)